MPLVRRTSKTPLPDYEKLGKTVYELMQFSAEQPKRMYSRAFVRGVFSGLGSAIGATIVLTCLIWFLTLFGNVPLIGRLVELVRESTR